MATYAELLDMVYVLTKRPDLIAETAAQVKKATFRLHARNWYKRDLKIVTYALPVSTTYRYSIDITNIANFPRFRKVSVLKEYVSPPTGTEVQYEELSADNLFDEYRLEKTNYWYLAGASIELRAAVSTSNIKMIYWQYPDITAAGFTSWIAVDFPDAIAEEAAKNIFKIIGKDEEFQKFEKLTEANEAILDGIGI